MKIEDIQINGFGKLQNKNIKLEEKINIIYGKNEAGKSTLLKFIISMFYGLSKNKNGGTIAEIEKYEPWDNDEFSGKISYRLDNNEFFEVYREFKKKNPKIYNEKFEDISKKFSIDKTKGNLFFSEQTGIDEELLKSTIITEQQNVKLNQKEQSSLIQKISNILGTGEDTVSYNTILNKLKKKLLDDIGTENSKERPINLVRNKIEKINKNINIVEEFKDKKEEIKENLEKNNETLNNIIKKEEELKKANLQIEKLNYLKNKIDINNDIIKKTLKDIEVVDNNIKELKNKKNNKIGIVKKIIISILLILTIAVQIFIKGVVLRIISFIPIIFYLMYNLYNNYKNRKRLSEKIRDLASKISILEENNKSQLKELKENTIEYETKLKEIKEKYNILNEDRIKEDITFLQEEKNRASINIKTLQINIENLNNSTEDIIKLKESLESLKEEESTLLKKQNQIQLAIQYINLAYEKMREEITPKFTEKLSKSIKIITNNTYEKVRLNTLGELLVENKKGEYINAEQLSIGTIDQLYLSLRLGAITNLTRQNMPIILDEAFAYFDDERLQNILMYLIKEYPDKQIIIFTCTNREKNILDKINKTYNYIEV